MKPFGQGSVNSAYTDNDWDSGFYYNTPPPYGCASYTIEAQKLNVGTLYKFPSRTGNLSYCQYFCAFAYGITIAAYNVPTYTCYCLNTIFNSVAMQYDTQWNFGLLAL